MLQENVKAAWEYGRQFLDQGKTADYIPELGKADPSRFGICVRTTDGQSYEYGDTDFRFTMQSISKIVSLAAALDDKGNSIGGGYALEYLSRKMRLHIFDQN